MESLTDICNVIHCTFLREEDEQVFLVADDETEYQVQKSSVDLDNLPCTIQGKDDTGVPVLFVVSSDKDQDEAEIQNHDNTIRWTHTNTKLLMEWYPEYKRKVLNRSLPTYRRMWELIARRFVELGLEVNAGQVENRWKTLDRSYRRDLRHPGKRTNSYFNDMKKIFGQFPASRSLRSWTNQSMDISENELESSSIVSTSRNGHLLGIPNREKKKETSPVLSPSQGPKVRSISRELAFLRASFTQRQEKKNAFEEVKERNRAKRHNDEMALLSAIIDVLAKKKTKVQKDPIQDC